MNPQNGSWVLFTISRNSLFRGSLYRGLSVLSFFLQRKNYALDYQIHKQFILETKTKINISIDFRYLQSVPQQTITLSPLFFTWDTAKWLVRRRHAPNNNKLFTKPLNKSQNLAEIVLYFGYRLV